MSIKEALIGVSGTKAAPTNDINTYKTINVIMIAFLDLSLLSILTKAYAAAGNINGNNANVCLKS